MNPSGWTRGKRSARASAGPRLAAAAGLDPAEVDRKIMERAERSFLYLRRHVDPDTAARVRDLAIPGVYLEREFRRYYPEAEAVAHIVGFTDIDGVGQEGVELAHDAVLRGVSGAKQVIQDRFGRSVEDVQNVRSARPGRDVHLTIDLRLQSLAYRALKAAVVHHEAAAGSVVVVDVRTGEIHAMVNQPSYKPERPGEAQRTGHPQPGGHRRVRARLHGQALRSHRGRSSPARSIPGPRWTPRLATCGSVGTWCATGATSVSSTSRG